MPNVKIFVDAGVLDRRQAVLIAALPALRALLMQRLAVDKGACQLAVIGVQGLPDQPLVNVELAILPKPERTRDLVTEVARAVQALVATAAEVPTAVRISQLDAATYVAVK